MLSFQDLFTSGQSSQPSNPANSEKVDEDTGKKIGYFSGTIDLSMLGQIKIAVFKNNWKEKDSQPDYNIILSEPKKQSNDEVEVNDDSVLHKLFKQGIFDPLRDYPYDS